MNSTRPLSFYLSLFVGMFIFASSYHGFLVVSQTSASEIEVFNTFADDLLSSIPGALFLCMPFVIFGLYCKLRFPNPVKSAATPKQGHLLDQQIDYLSNELRVASSGTPAERIFLFGTIVMVLALVVVVILVANNNAPAHLLLVG